LSLSLKTVFFVAFNKVCAYLDRIPVLCASQTKTDLVPCFGRKKCTSCSSEHRDRLFFAQIGFTVQSVYVEGLHDARRMRNLIIVDRVLKYGLDDEAIPRGQTVLRV
jgi:hypothetical protein